MIMMVDRRKEFLYISFAWTSFHIFYNFVLMESYIARSVYVILYIVFIIVI
jgi:hypothetical protein